MSLFDVVEKVKGRVMVVVPRVTGANLLWAIFNPNWQEPKIKRAVKPGKTTQRYRAMGVSVRAATKSEGRAKIKHILGLDRLPPGTVVAVSP